MQTRLNFEQRYLASMAAPYFLIGTFSVALKLHLIIKIGDYGFMALGTLVFPGLLMLFYGILCISGLSRVTRAPLWLCNKLDEQLGSLRRLKAAPAGFISLRRQMQNIKPFDDSYTLTTSEAGEETLSAPPALSNAASMLLFARNSLLFGLPCLLLSFALNTLIGSGASNDLLAFIFVPLGLISLVLLFAIYTRRTWVSALAPAIMRPACIAICSETHPAAAELRNKLNARAGELRIVHQHGLIFYYPKKGSVLNESF